MKPAIFSLGVLSLALLPSVALATDPWVERRLTLKSNPIGGSVDAGLGFGHFETPAGRGSSNYNGLGFNAEGVLGIINRIDIGLRLAVRVNDDSSIAQADSYARTYDSNTFYPFVAGARPFANPELRVRGKLLDVGVFELGVEGRTIFPVGDPDTRASVVVGVPMAVHVRSLLRIDTGVYTVFSFYDRAGTYADRTIFVFDVPANFWFQVTPQIWLGPMTGFRVYNDRYYFSNSSADFILGFGMGITLAKFLDLKWQAVFPRLNEGVQYVGAGVGVGFVFE